MNKHSLENEKIQVQLVGTYVSVIGMKCYAFQANSDITVDSGLPWKEEIHAGQLFGVAVQRYWDSRPFTIVSLPRNVLELPSWKFTPRPKSRASG